MMPISALYATLGLVWMGSYSLAFSMGRIDLVTCAFVFCSFFFGVPNTLLLTFFTSLGMFGFFIGLIMCYSEALAILRTYNEY